MPQSAVSLRNCSWRWVELLVHSGARAWTLSGDSCYKDCWPLGADSSNRSARCQAAAGVAGVLKKKKKPTMLPTSNGLFSKGSSTLQMFATYVCTEVCFLSKHF